NILGPHAATLAELRGKFPDLEPWWKEQFGHDFNAITENEAKYLLRFKSADRLRNEVLEAGQAHDLGAAASEPEYWRKGGEGLEQIKRLRAEGQSAKEIADALDICESFAEKILAREGLTRNAYVRLGARIKQMEEIRKLDAEGKDIKDIASVVGVAAASNQESSGSTPSNKQAVAID